MSVDEVQCGNKCVDLQNDPKNCGACDNIVSYLWERLLAPLADHLSAILVNVSKAFVRLRPVSARRAARSWTAAKLVTAVASQLQRAQEHGVSVELVRVMKNVPAAPIAAVGSALLKHAALTMCVLRPALANLSAVSRPKIG